MLPRYRPNLKSEGYDVGPIDGLVGARTTAAIKRFQISKGLDPTGRPSPELLLILRTQKEHRWYLPKGFRNIYFGMSLNEFNGVKPGLEIYTFFSSFRLEMSESPNNDLTKVTYYFSTKPEPIVLNQKHKVLQRKQLEDPLYEIIFKYRQETDVMRQLNRTYGEATHTYAKYPSWVFYDENGFEIVMYTFRETVVFIVPELSPEM